MDGSVGRLIAGGVYLATSNSYDISLLPKWRMEPWGITTLFEL